MLSAIKNYLVNIFVGDSSEASILPFIPRPLRVLFVVLLVLNSRSLPFVWHLRVFRPVFNTRLKWLSLSLSSSKTKDAWLDSLCPIGKSPFELKETYKTWASPDESDYNIHLSNSSYAKVLDMLRLKFALATMSAIFRDECWIALGASHLKFIREIPLGSKYEIRMYVGSWDSKWMYVVARYVTKHNLASAKEKPRDQLQRAKEALLDASSSSTPGGIPLPRLHTPASADASGTSTPNPTLISSASEFDSLWSEAPGETLHCIAVNEVCFKRGRVTVPPGLALAMTGCGMSAERWAELKKMRSGGGMRDLILGGWRDAPEGTRWWDEAMSSFEDERIRRLSVLKGLREGLETTKFL